MPYRYLDPSNILPSFDTGKNHRTDDVAGALRGCIWGVIHRAELNDLSFIHHTSDTAQYLLQCGETD